MKIKKITWQNRRDFEAIYECEHCGSEQKGEGYDDDNYHRNVIPKMKCKRCGINKVQSSVYCITCSTNNVPQGRANDRERSAYVQLSDVRELAEKIIIAHEKLSKFAGGNHHRHNGCCNYIGTTQGWCNCGVSDLDKAKEIADKILAHF